MTRGKRDAGYALVAAMSILLLITLLGALAMVTSVSEQYLTTAQGENSMLFSFAEQGAERVLSHLHYKEGGLFANTSGLNYSPVQGTDTLNPMSVITNGKGLYQSGSSVALKQEVVVNAYLDPKNFEGWWDRGISRPVAITVNVANTAGHYSKTFRVYAKPKSIWDFAYFSLNHNPSQRTAVCLSNWYSCHTVFMDEDTVGGDLYVSNTVYNSTVYFQEQPHSTTPLTLFVRGRPTFSGEVRWRGPQPFDNDVNQTYGGSGVTAEPRVGQRMRANALPIMPPYPSVLTTHSNGYRQAADLIFAAPGAIGTSTAGVWRFIFRNDIDTNNDGVAADTRVASAITRSINRAVSPTLGHPTNEDRGVMMVYRLPFADPTEIETEQNQRAAFFGDTMRARDEAMATRVDTSTTDIRWSSDASLAWQDSITGKKCYGTMVTPVPNLKDDITPGYDYMYIPSRGLTTTGSGSGCSGTYTGIIFVEGDVVVSGILDAQVTIVATGNIYIDHEIEYENHPKTVRMDEYANIYEPDILGLYATGNIIIPNSYPEPGRVSPPDSRLVRHPYRDDWSDASLTQGAVIYPPAGQLDEIAVTDDYGDEDIQAVMLSYAHEPCTKNASNNFSCSTPTTTEIRNFTTGLYATPRTYRVNRTQALWSDPANLATGAFNTDGGNSSGRLTIIGAVIQYIPGRLAYDFQRSTGSQNATCTGGSGSTCHRIGFSAVDYLYDQRLQNMIPPYPRQASSSNNYKTPYGYAAWDIISWEELGSNTSLSQSVW